MRSVKWMVGVFVLMANCAFSTETVQELKNLPKAELHLHLGGAFPKDYLFSIATPYQQEELQQALEQIAQGIDYHAVFHVFRLVAQVVNTEDKVQQGVERLCTFLREDHVRYVEIRTGIKDLGHGHEAYLNAVLAGLQAHVSPDFKANVVLSIQRSSPLDVVKATVDLAIKYQNRKVVGIDISGNSTLGQIDRLIPELLRAKAAGIPFVIHLGEAPHEPDQMLLLTTLEPKRIGHGVYLSSEAKEWVLKHRIPVEVCLTSSLLVKMVDRYEDHPGFEFFRSNHPVVFCTDDPLLFSTTGSQELGLAHQYGRLPLEDLKCAVEHSFDYTLENIDGSNL
jgi:adenosine deaminase